MLFIIVIWLWSLFSVPSFLQTQTHQTSLFHCSESLTFQFGFAEFKKERINENEEVTEVMMNQEKELMKKQFNGRFLTFIATGELSQGSK